MMHAHCLLKPQCAYFSCPRSGKASRLNYLEYFCHLRSTSLTRTSRLQIGPPFHFSTGHIICFAKGCIGSSGLMKTVARCKIVYPWTLAVNLLHSDASSFIDWRATVAGKALQMVCTAHRSDSHLKAKGPDLNCSFRRSCAEHTCLPV